MTDLQKLIEVEIPDGRRNLQDNFNNLEKVAQYCQENYVQSTDKRKALEETKNFTTHSLASVAYQINNLATNFLKLLDLQQSQLAEMESNVNHLAQTVSIHKEKVARREIGVLTTNKSTTRQLGVKNGIIFPEHGEKTTKYVRKKIDFTQLDDIGHGVKDPRALDEAVNNVDLSRIGSLKTGQPGGSSKPTRSGSVSSQSSGPAPIQQPPGVPQGGHGSLGRASGQQMLQGPNRTPAPAVAPPIVPNPYMSRQQLEQQRSSGTYQPSTPPVMMGHMRAPPGMMPGMMPDTHMMGPPPPPPVGMAMPMSHGQPGPPGMMMQGDRSSQLQQQQQQQQQQYRGSHIQDARTSQISMQRQNSIENLPPPPMEETDLPPPPDDSFEEGGIPPPPPPQFNDTDYPVQEEDPYAATGPDLFTQAVPDHYLEKVIAIYDYSADKEDELTFSENSVIYVMKKNDDGWYEGVLNGQTGLFPGNYVEPCI